MTKAARRHGADVIRYSLRAKNSSISSSSSSSNSGTMTAGRRRTLPVNHRHDLAPSLAAVTSFPPDVTSQLHLSVAAAILLHAAVRFRS